jgi:hypothetical protein
MKKITAIFAALTLASTSAIASEFDNFEFNGGLKPGMTVSFPKSAPTCAVMDDLRKLSLHALKGEKAEAEALYYVNGGSCGMLDPSVKFKVISVSYNLPDMPDAGVIQIVKLGESQDYSLWAFSFGAVTQK